MSAPSPERRVISDGQSRWIMGGRYITAIFNRFGC
jgi:hypothetical protein